MLQNAGSSKDVRDLCCGEERKKNKNLPLLSMLCHCLIFDLFSSSETSDKD